MGNQLPRCAAIGRMEGSTPLLLAWNAWRRRATQAQEADEDGEKKVLPFPWKLIKRHPYNLDATTGPSQLKGTGIRDKWKAMKVAWQKADSGERVLEHCCKDEVTDHACLRHPFRPVPLHCFILWHPLCRPTSVTW